ncbi:MAG: TonB-dependent receptor [Terriglobales bacterium]
MTAHLGVRGCRNRLAGPVDQTRPGKRNSQVRQILVRGLLLAAWSGFLLPPAVRGQGPAGPSKGVQLSGTVQDGLERPIADARVFASAASGAPLATTATDATGHYHLALPATLPAGQPVTVFASKPSFAEARVRLSVGRSGVLVQDFRLGLAPMQQSLIVAATGVSTPEVQLGQAVSVIEPAAWDKTPGVTADSELRLQPGVQMVRTGAVGGLTSLSIRGGEDSFTKILIDGVPTQRVDFGGYDFSTLTPGTLDEVQIVRGADSVVYGSDAVTGVVAIQSRRGSSVPAPELNTSLAGGNFGTVQQNSNLLGLWRGFDYGLGFDYLDTHNALPNNKFRDLTYAENLGWRMAPGTTVRLTSRYTRSSAGAPNAMQFFGIPDDSFQRQGETYSGLTVSQQTTRRWQNRVQVSQGSVNEKFENPSPTGTPSDPSAFANFLGNPVTITGANGYSVSGQAILDFAGTYPSIFNSDTLRRDANWESSFQITPAWNVLGGYRYYDERGLTSGEQISRHDHGLYAEVNGGAWNRLFTSLGVSHDWNVRFGNTTNPQASVAFFPRLARSGWFDETRLRSSAGTGLKDPSIFAEESSLYEELLSGSGGAGVVARLHVQPIHPQRSHNFDLGVDQYFAGDRLRASATVFRNTYYDLIEFVPTSAFPLLGVPPDAAALTFGANLNSLTERAKGVELELQARTRSGWRADASYTHLDARVLKSFSSDALSPSFNPSFPTIPIGAYSPLVGARPFRRAPESGSFRLGYEQRRWVLQGDAYFASRRDDSTFLSDANFGTTLLLPNHNLAPAYGVFNMSGFFQLTRRITVQGAVENLLNKHYDEAFGYPALGRTARIGLQFALLAPHRW